MLFIITGLMASGKSTVAEALARRLPRAVHLRGDHFRRMIVSGRAEMGPAPSQEALDQLQLRYHLSAMVAIQYLKAGFDVVLQDNYYGQHWADMLDRLSGWQPCAFVLDPGLQVIQEREAARGKAGYHAFSIADLYADFHQTTPRLGSWVDNSRMTVDETVDLLLKLM